MTKIKGKLACASPLWVKIEKINLLLQQKNLRYSLSKRLASPKVLHFPRIIQVILLMQIRKNSLNLMLVKLVVCGGGTL